MRMSHIFLSTVVSVVLLLLGHGGIARAADHDSFRSYNTANGLSDNAVSCALRDSYGFMWFGTSNGLNCFDGVSTIVYRDFGSGAHFLGSNVVTSLLEYNRDIFVGGALGVSVFNRDTNRFSRFDATTKYGVMVSSTVQKMLKTSSGLVWICTLGQGFFVYNPDKGSLLQCSRYGGFVSDVVQTSDGTVYVSTINGMLNAFTEHGRFIRSYAVPGYVNDKSKITLFSSGTDIWLGTDAGLYLFSGKTAAFRHFAPPANFGAINAVEPSGGGSLLLGTNMGLWSFGGADNSFVRIDGPDRISGLDDQNINNLLVDSDGTLWVMTDIGGVSYLPKFKPLAQFVKIPGVGYGEKALVRAFCYVGGNIVYVGTSTGLYRYDLSTRTISPCAAFANYNVTSLLLDGNRLWVGTWQNGVKVLNLSSGETRSYIYSEKVPYTVTSNKIRRIFKSSKGIIYVATNWGLCRFDPRTEHFFPFRILNSMTDFTDMGEGRDGYLWAVTNNRGAYRYRVGNDEWINYTFNRADARSLSSNSLIQVFCDSRGRVWFATKGGGLCRYDASRNCFVRIPGIDANVYFVCEDSRHNLWVSTDMGVVKMTGGDEGDIQHVISQNDLWQGPLNQSGTLLLPSGLMLFGSEDGFYCMHPEQLPVEKSAAPVYVVSISLPYVSNQENELERLGLDRLLYVSRRVELPYSDNSFTLHFSSPRFNSNRGVRFEYMLRGIDKQWARGVDNREATYANIPPGKYQFLLREAGTESNVSVLEIEVLPPWYRTYTAYIVYLLLVAGIVWLSVRRARASLQHRYDEHLNRIRRDQEKKAFEGKIKFFVNLVHEIRTPLSLISLPLERMEEAPHSAADRKYMEIIRRNMNYLLGITNQLLDFQKTESGTKKMDKVNTSMHDMLRDVCNFYEAYGEMERKHVELKLPDYDITTAVDRDCMKKILMNLMSNALKYANTHIVVTMRRAEGDKVVISVIDDGPGIPDADKKKIFTSFYQVGDDRIAKILGTGLGLAYASTLAAAHGGALDVTDAAQGGSCFNFTLPIVLVDGGTTAVEEKRQNTAASLGDISDDGDDTRQFSVLVVEDNAELLGMTCDVLRDWYRVYKAANGVEALNVLAGESVDVIVSDVMMPVMDGIELCRRVKGDINYSHIPLIMLTAKITLEAKVEGMESGADVYLEKPFSIQQLHLQIKNLLRMRQNFHKRMSSLNGDLEELQPSEFGLTRQNLQFVERVQQILAENMSDEGFSIDSMAGMMNMSRSSFYRKLKSLTGQSPVDFLKSQRITRAAALLLEGYNITEVSVKVGFSSASYFTKCFKQQFNMLPKEYVKSRQEKQ